jgi:hypothetical protein
MPNSIFEHPVALQYSYIRNDRQNDRQNINRAGITAPGTLPTRTGSKQHRPRNHV